MLEDAGVGRRGREGGRAGREGGGARSGEESSGGGHLRLRREGINGRYVYVYILLSKHCLFSIYFLACDRKKANGAPSPLLSSSAWSLGSFGHYSRFFFISRFYVCVCGGGSGSAFIQQIRHAHGVDSLYFSDGRWNFRRTR